VANGEDQSPVNASLESGTELTVEDADQVCRIEQLLGSGGQGEVYRASLAGRPVAVKWYYPASATADQRAILLDLVRKGSPDARFLWPVALVGAAGSDSFGYVMELRDDRFSNIPDLLARRVTPTFRTLATAGLHLTDGYFQLHARGWCYRDISHNNAFFDPVTGDILICDNDNVGPDGAPSNIGGTLQYMAPEVVRGDAVPSVQTDLHSLAVLLFLLLMNHHPLEGRREADIHCFDFAAKQQMYGTDPLFIWDPDNAENRPEEGYQDNAIIFWDIYPTFLREVFVEAFTVGLHRVDARVREGRWRSTLSRLRDSVMYCPNCRRQNFYDVDRLQATGGDPGACWGCRHRLRVPPRIRIGRTTVMLNHDARLFAHHVDSSGGYAFDTPIAEVNQHPTDPTIWGLTNLTGTPWTATDAAGVLRPVDPGRSATLATGTRIRFGAVEGEIRL
jgi:serine/threonine protein kinase